MLAEVLCLFQITRASLPVIAEYVYVPLVIGMLRLNVQFVTSKMVSPKVI